MARRQALALDPLTWRAVYETISHAHTFGLDVAEALNSRDLLLTPAARKEIRCAEVGGIVTAMELWTPSEYLLRVRRRGEAATPTDMYTGILGWLKEFEMAVREGS